MEKVIFDASFFLSILLPDEEVPDIDKLRAYKEGNVTLVVPFLFSFEVMNALRYAFSAKRIKRVKLDELIEQFQNLNNIEYVYNYDFKKLLGLSLEHDISVYDASYLYLKVERGLALYTHDKKLALV